MEIKDIPFNTAYSINDNGSIIISKLTGHLVKSSIQQLNGKLTGYLYATLCNCINQFGDYTPQLPKRIAVHRLVAFTWIGEPPTPEHKWINHIDGNKANNHYTNLEWSTIAENIQHAYNTGLKVAKKGKEHHRFGKSVSNKVKAKMSEAKKGAKHPKFKGYYYANFKRFESANQAAEYLNISANTVIRRCNNENFRLKGYYFLQSPN